MGQPSLESLARARGRARDSLRQRTEALREGVLAALAAGESEVSVARRAGVDRMTVRRWAGKR